MPSQKTASKEEKKIKVQVLRGIGVPADKETIAKYKMRAERKGIAFTEEGLTTMVYPSKPVFDKKQNKYVPGEDVFIDLDIDIAKKLDKAGAIKRAF